MIPTLLQGHRIDDRLNMRELFLVGLLLRELFQIAHSRQQPQQLLERSHLANRPQLIAKIL